MPQTPPLAVFIADDSAPVADMLREFLADPGKVEVVGVADSEAETIDAIRKLKPDVVVLDLQLKVGSGADVIRAVRALPELAQVNIFVTSNYTSPQLRAGCLELGASAYFDKVKELAALSAEVARLAAAKRG